MRFFENKVIWITGASSGIGEGLVYAFVQEGAKIILSARRKEELERVKKEAGSASLYVLPLDLSQSETFAQKTQEAIQAFGHVDLMVHNGGMSKRSLVDKTEMELHRHLMEVNYFSYVALTKELLPHFQARKTGHFIVTSSIMGKIGTPKRSAYAASKHALHGFFDCLRSEVWQDNIKVTVICPGYINTNVGNAIGGGYPVDKTAIQIMNAIRKGKYEVFVGQKFGKEHLGWIISWLAPGLFMNIAKKQVVPD
jgi:short-subunit dehydrogenase